MKNIPYNLLKATISDMNLTTSSSSPPAQSQTRRDLSQPQDSIAADQSRHIIADETTESPTFDPIGSSGSPSDIMRQGTRAAMQNSATFSNTEEDTYSAILSNIALGLDREYPANDTETQKQMKACQQEVSGMISRQTTYGIAPEAQM